MNEDKSLAMTIGIATIVLALVVGALIVIGVTMAGCAATTPAISAPTTPTISVPTQPTIESPVSTLQPEDHYVFDGDEYLRKVSKVKGMTVENAKHYLAELGHTGEIFVTELYQYDAGCAQGRVCSYSIVRKPEDDIKLWINRKVTISTP